MYNVEKYIGALLESLLTQTFQDFEVIVVDDCSTDNSCAVVESYVTKFGGRLKLSRMEKNSGGPGAPSNKAVALSRGKYVYVMDDDDLLVNNALEILYNYAEKFNADVVQMDKVLEFVTNTEKPFPDMKELLMSHRKSFHVDKPTIETDTLPERIIDFCKGKFTWQAWAALVKRDLLMENNIIFPSLKSSADIIWTIEIILYAKIFLHIPDICYIYRHRPNSITRSLQNLKDRIKFWMDINFEGIKFLDGLLERQKFFQENPQYKWILLNHFNSVHSNNISRLITHLNTV